jgi:hypothetical protein
MLEVVVDVGGMGTYRKRVENDRTTFILPVVFIRTE